MDDDKARLSSALEGRYRVESVLGEGGMAVVYAATDLKHERKVALKVLKPELAMAVGAERFLSEIKTTAVLQQPHILPLFDSGEADGLLYYVMPYVDGESLRERLEREGPLPVDEAARIATEVGQALHAAHEQGIIHRDIKPANILLSRGRALVADFGIAVAVDTAGGSRLTQTGISVGTPSYMSPEQASGDRPPSAAGDVYSLGCVLYEMLVGEPPHTGITAQAILAKILTEEPVAPIEARTLIPANVDAVVRKALEKLPADRFATAHAFVVALSDQQFRHGEPGDSHVPPVSRKLLTITATTTILAVVFGLSAVRLWSNRVDQPQPVPLLAEISGIDVRALLQHQKRIAVSPSGLWFVVAGGDSSRSLLIRPSDRHEWRQLPETVGATNPTISPDDQWVAFVDGGDLWRIPIEGGTRQAIASDAGEPRWLSADSLVFGRGGALYKTAATGGEERLFADVANLSISRFDVLPGEEAVVFSESTGGDPTAAAIYLANLETDEVRQLVPSGVSPRYVPTGYLVYAHGDQRLMAVEFDLEGLQVVGNPVTVIPELTVRPGGAAQFDISANGTLFFNGVGLSRVTQRRVLSRVEMDGSGASLPLPPGEFTEVSYSPDGRRLAVTYENDIHVYDALTGDMTRLTDGGAQAPAWSADGLSIYFTTTEGIFRKRTEAGGLPEPPEPVYTGPGPAYVTDVFQGDSVILIERFGDLHSKRAGSDAFELQPYLTASWREALAVLAPDQARVAYVSSQTGSDEVWVRSFPDAQDPVRLSSGGGSRPLWSSDGLAVYYLNGSRIMKVPATSAGTFDPPQLLGERPAMVFTGGAGASRRIWDIDPRTSHFVLVEAAAGERADSVSTSGLYIVVHWFEQLRDQVPVR